MYKICSKLVANVSHRADMQTCNLTGSISRHSNSPLARVTSRRTPNTQPNGLEINSLRDTCFCPRTKLSHRSAKHSFHSLFNNKVIKSIPLRPVDLGRFRLRHTTWAGGVLPRANQRSSTSSMRSGNVYIELVTRGRSE